MTIRIICQCGKKYNFADRFAGSVTRCIACNGELMIPAPSRQEDDLNNGIGQVTVQGPSETKLKDVSDTSPAVCQICFSPLEEPESFTQCPECKTMYHTECWQENGGCGMYGCTLVPPTENRDELEVPIAYWGRETKPCPICNEEIMATALRCRHCGTVFESADLISAEELQAAKEISANLPGTKRRAIWLFVFCLIPFTAAIAALIALGWKKVHAAEIRKLPRIYGALCNIGIAIGFGQTALIVIVAALYAALRT